MGSPRDYVAELVALVGAPEAKDRGRGLHGYTHSVDVGGFGLVGFGGRAQRGTVFVSVNGAGCQRVAQFGAFVDWCVARQGRITRLDVAADDFEGRNLSVADALEAWRGGRFNNCGTPCKGQLLDDLGSGRGSTFYAGARASGKLCRVYEKGKQLGESSSPWVRAEVEFLARDRVIPWSAVVDPLPVFAGAYPFFRRFSLCSQPLTTFKRSEQMSFDAVVEWARRACGKTINVLLERACGDIGEVVSSLRRDGVPRRLGAYVRG